MTPEEKTIEFVRFVIQKICSKPDHFSIKEIHDERGILLEITIAPEDIGRVIGKNGQTISALRLLVHTLSGERETKNVTIKILEPIEEKE